MSWDWKGEERVGIRSDDLVSVCRRLSLDVAHSHSMHPHLLYLRMGHVASHVRHVVRARVANLPHRRAGVRARRET